MTIETSTSAASPSAKLPRPGRVFRFVIGLCAIASSGLAAASNTLESLSFRATAGDSVELVMALSATPPADAKLFATESPPRIAVDLPATRNAVTQRRVDINLGSAVAASAVEAGGRTRVVIELLRAGSYSTRVEGNNLVLQIGAASSGAMQTVNSDPTKAISRTKTAIDSVDFRRGATGEGRIIVNFSSADASPTMRREGSRVVVELPGVAVPDERARKLDVTDFATAVQSINVVRTPAGGRLEIAINGPFEPLAYQTGTEYVVEIAPQREESPAQARLKEPEYKGERVTFNFQDIPVRSVLQLIADISGINIVVADSVQGNVTLRLNNVPWDQALDIVMQARGLDKRERGNVVWIAPTPEIAAREQAIEDARIAIEDRTPLISEFIPINYGNAEQIANLLTTAALRATGAGGGGAQGQNASGFLSSRGSVSFDVRTNTLLVSDIPSKLEEIRSLVSLLDRPVDQVLIESRIVIADETFGRELGARFGVSAAREDSNGNVVSTGGNLNGTDAMLNQALRNRFSRISPNAPVTLPGPPGSGILVPGLGQRLNVNLPVTNPAGSFALAVLGQDYLLDLELSALHSEGRGEVVSSPRVITANQREALIRQGEEVGYVTIAPQQGGNDIPIPNVQFKEALLELKVTPTITQDRRVFLAMNVKKDEISGFVSTSIGDVPQIAKREINTAVLVNDGQTVVLGGVYEFQNRDELSKVPFLGDLPAVGALFRNTARSSEKVELLIFVTPKIVNETQGAR
jgi:type IV pilus assembly protein PilQ